MAWCSCLRQQKLNKWISENTVVWSHIGHDFNKISIGIGIQGVGGAGKKEGNVPSNGTDEVKVREDTFYDTVTGNKRAQIRFDAKTLRQKFSNDKRSVSPNIYFAIESIKSDIHIRHINNLEMLAKDRQEYWRRPVIVYVLSTLVCPFFLS